MSVLKTTNWNAYYSQRVFFLTKMTRACLLKNLNDVLTKLFENKSALKVTEFGGGNSILLPLFAKMQLKQYLVVDNNQLGIDLLKERSAHLPWVNCQYGDIFDLELPTSDSDLVISVGLIEHFDREGTARALQAHIDRAADNCFIVITFPTPTWLYCVARKCLELFNFWQFPDETPLHVADVVKLIGTQGTLVSKKILWCQILTQAMIVVQKKASET